MGGNGAEERTLRWDRGQMVRESNPSAKDLTIFDSLREVQGLSKVYQSLCQ
jgi:hypothetical protein